MLPTGVSDHSFRRLVPMFRADVASLFVLKLATPIEG